MSEFARHMRQKLVESISKEEENPLETIGLSPVILDLKLTDDELFEYCLKAARHLFTMFHSDRRREGSAKDPHAIELEARFSNAFTALKDRATFNDALKTFREEKASQRSEANASDRMAQEISRSLRQSQTKLDRTIGELTETRKRQQETAERFMFHLLGGIAPVKTRKQLPDRWAYPVTMEDCTEIFSLHFQISSGMPPEPSHLDEIPELRNRTKLLRGLAKNIGPREREMLLCKFSDLRIQATSSDELINQALSSSDLLPRISWNREAALRKYGLLGLSRNQKPYPAATFDDLAPELQAHLNNLYRRHLETLRIFLARNAPFVNRLEVVPGRLFVSQRRIKKRSEKMDEHFTGGEILGSLSFDSLPQMRPSLYEGDDRLRTSVEHFCRDGAPLIIPGYFLARVGIDPLTWKVGMTPEHFKDALLKNKALNGVFCDHIVLAAQ